MIGGLPLGFTEPLVLIGLLTLPVLWWLLRLDSAAAAPARFPADAAPARNCAAGGNAGPHTVVAHAVTAGARRTRYYRRGRAALASAAGDDENERSGRDPDRRRLDRRRGLGCAAAHRRRHHRARRGRPARRCAYSAVRGTARYFTGDRGLGARAAAADPAGAVQPRPRPGAAVAVAISVQATERRIGLAVRRHRSRPWRRFREKAGASGRRTSDHRRQPAAFRTPAR